MNFKVIYHWNILEEIGKKNAVYILDRKELKLSLANEWVSQRLINLLEELKNSDNKDNRYEFWIDNEKENENE